MNKKVLFILHMPPPVHGAAMVGSYIKKSLRINSTFNTKYIRLGTTNSFEERGKTSLKKLFRLLGLLSSSLAKVLNFRPDYVYMTLTSSGMGFYKDAFLVLLLKLTGVKFVYHFHNKGVKNRQERVFDNWLYKRVFKNAEVILLSEYLYPDIKKYVKKDRVYICPNGIPQFLSDTDVEKHHSKQNHPQILFLSNLVETKGVYTLLKACKILKDRDVSYKCIFVGGEADILAYDLNKKISSMNLESEVFYAGKKYNEEKEAIFLESDIFAFPTYYPNECFPLVLLEAMQAGLPIVSTPEGGIREIVKENKNGFLVPQKDPVELAMKLEELIGNSELRNRMSRAGRMMYENKFTIQRFEKRLSEILEEAIIS